MIQLNNCKIIMLLALLLVVAGCGEDKTIYEDGTITSSTTTTITDTTTTTASSTPGDATNGATLFNSKCKSCHSASSLKNTTVANIKSNAMTYGLTDSELNDVVAYLSNL
ncbi:cytochrome c [Geobacter sp. FeAm09]|uniref:cytochrome c n=1 Tax=Geobacter sp. FeAm09 TaxID=2597769 RepID=UPI0011EF06FF|nr:cytochrome c [Geobacter sp. FeAm09]QEM68954.1 cytochrome c [Geobacter sp. FeAm09]